MPLVANTLGKAWLALAVFFLGVGTVAQMLSSGSTVAKSVGAILGGILAIAEIRIVRAGVVQKDGMVIVRNWTRTWRVSRLDITQVAVVPSGNAAGGATCVGFWLNDGRLIKAMPTASYSAKKVAGYRAQLIFL